MDCAVGVEVEELDEGESGDTAVGRAVDRQSRVLLICRREGPARALQAGAAALARELTVLIAMTAGCMCGEGGQGR